MTSDEAGRSEERKSVGSKSPCLHQRVIDYHYDEKNNRSGKFVCRECGEIIPDPTKSQD